MGDGAGFLPGVCAGVLLVAVLGCGHSEPGKQPSAEGEGFETSWTGYLSKTYEGDYDLCVDATAAALRKLGLKPAGEAGGIFKTSFDVESEDGTSGVVQVTGLTKDSCRLTIKVGYFMGDQYAAQRIHSEIEGEIGARRAAAKDMQRKWSGAASGGVTTTVPPPGAAAR